MVLWRYIIFTNHSWWSEAISPVQAQPSTSIDKHMPRPIRAVVNPAAIDANIKQIKSLRAYAELMPVVKANAYGHGLARIFSGLGEADSLALLELEGARTLRELGWTKPLLLLEGCFDADDLKTAMALECDWVIHNDGQLKDLLVLARQGHQHKPRIFLKVNTGMNRLGFPPAQAQAAITELAALATAMQWPTPVLMTHYANADEQEPRTKSPAIEFQHQQLMRLKPQGWLSSMGNSAGALNFPTLAGDIARPGISIYGATPGPKTAKAYGLKAAMQLRSQIIAIQQVKPGDAVGYGSRWRASSPARIAVVACGYADGYPRHAPDGTPTGVLGQVAPLVGRVSMDMMTIDVTQIAHADVGTDVELWGDQVPVDEVAALSGTIGYELLCAVAPRVPFELINKEQ